MGRENAKKNKKNIVWGVGEIFKSWGGGGGGILRTLPKAPEKSLK